MSKIFKIDLLTFLFSINIFITIIVASLLLFYDFYIESLLFFIACIGIYYNKNCFFCSFFYSIFNLFYIHRIVLLLIDIDKFYYEKIFFTYKSFSEAIFITVFFLFVASIIFYYINNRILIAKTRIKEKEYNILFFIALIVYYSIFILLAIIGKTTIGFEIPDEFRNIVRLSQIFIPLTFVLFTDIFKKKQILILVCLSVISSLLIGSKAIFYNLLLAYLIGKLLFEKNDIGYLSNLFFLTLISAPFIYLLSNYVRYSEGMQIYSILEYIKRELSLEIYYIISNRFAYFDTLVAFISHHHINNFTINFNEYIYELYGAINRFAPGEIINIPNYLPFEQKTVHILKSFSLENRTNLGNYTESMGLSKFYFLGKTAGSIVLVSLFLFVTILSLNKNFLFRLFAFYYLIEILTGSDIQSLVVILVNSIILYALIKGCLIIVKKVRHESIN